VTWFALGLPLPSFYRWIRPLAGQESSPKFGRVPLGLRQRKPTRIATPLENPIFS
jgi:hypothetical protein